MWTIEKIAKIEREFNKSYDRIVYSSIEWNINWQQTIRWHTFMFSEFFKKSRQKIQRRTESNLLGFVVNWIEIGDIIEV